MKMACIWLQSVAWRFVLPVVVPVPVVVPLVVVPVVVPVVPVVVPAVVPVVVPVVVVVVPVVVVVVVVTPSSGRQNVTWVIVKSVLWVSPVVGPNFTSVSPVLYTKMTGTDEVKVSLWKSTVPEIVTVVLSTVMSSSNSVPSLPSIKGSTTKRGIVPSGQSVSSCALAGEAKTPSVASAIIAIMAISTSAIQYGLVVVVIPFTKADPLP